MTKKRFKVVQITKVVTSYYLQCCHCDMLISIDTEIILDILNDKLGGYGGLTCSKCNFEYCITKKDIEKDIPYPTR